MLDWRLMLEVITGTLGFLIITGVISNPEDKNVLAKIAIGTILLAICLVLIF